MSATLPVQMEVVNMATGEVTEQRTVPFSILPPPATACQVCGHDPAHPADQPHNAQTLYYQYSFFGEHGRWPTWRDAVAHCADDVKASWEAHLRGAGAWPADEVPAMTPVQRDLARHAVGLDGRHKQTWRNHFVTGEGSTDYPHWMAMVEAGHATRRDGSVLTGGDDFFRLTRAGAELALDAGESLNEDTFPAVPAQAQP